MKQFERARRIFSRFCVIFSDFSARKPDQSPYPEGQNLDAGYRFRTKTTQNFHFSSVPKPSFSARLVSSIYRYYQGSCRSRFEFQTPLSQVTSSRRGVCIKVDLARLSGSRSLRRRERVKSVLEVNNLHENILMNVCN